MKLKRQISKHKMQRIKDNPNAIKGVVEIQAKYDFGVDRSIGYYLDGYVYTNIHCRTNKPCATVRHTTTFCRYVYQAGESRVDNIIFFVGEDK